MSGLQLNGERATIARYPNQPGGVETSCGYGCMVAGGDAKWTPPDFNKYGNVTYYTDMVPAHKRNDSAAGGGLDNWFSHCELRETPEPPPPQVVGSPPGQLGCVLRCIVLRTAYCSLALVSYPPLVS